MKTVMVDDSKIVTDLLMTICARIGNTNSIHYNTVRPEFIFRIIFKIECNLLEKLMTFGNFCSSGITNYDEYSLVRDIGEEKKEEITGTLKRDKTLLRDDKKMEKLKQKLHTDDECMSDIRQTAILNVHGFYYFETTHLNILGFRNWM